MKFNVNPPDHQSFINNIVLDSRQQVLLYAIVPIDMLLSKSPAARLVARSCTRSLSATLAKRNEELTPKIIATERITPPLAALGLDSSIPPSSSFDPSVSYTFRPKSASYFTGNSVYNDNLLKLEELSRKYSKLPELEPGTYPKTYWRTIEQYREIDPTSHVRPTDYKKLLNILNKLNRTDREYMPTEVQDIMLYYTRERLGADPIKKDLKPDHMGKAFGVGRRKESVSQVWLVRGTGELFVNGRTLPEYCKRLHDREQVLLPLSVTDRVAQYNVWAHVDGGGTTGQAEAVKLGLARALIIHEPDLKGELRKAGCMTADRRRVERKKTGKPKARKSYTWVKR